jgi:rhamnose transport system permease protein
MKKSINLRKYISREVGILAIILLLFFIASFIEPRFFALTAIIDIFMSIPFLLIVSLGLTMEVVSQNIDISLGSILAFSGYIVAMIFELNKSFPILLAFLISTVFGAFLGLINGAIVIKFKLPAVIVTLGTMNFYRGMIFIIGGRQIDRISIPDGLIRLSQPHASVVYIPYTILIALAITVLVTLFMQYTRKGREIYATGCSPEAAKQRGINVNGVRLLVFILSGGLSGLAGIIFISRIGYFNPAVAGKGLEFIAIAAVVIGGTSLSGGIGTPIGTFLGVLLLGVINNAISIMGVSPFWQEAVYGIIIIIAVVLDKTVRTRLIEKVGT